MQYERHSYLDSGDINKNQNKMAVVYYNIDYTDLKYSRFLAIKVYQLQYQLSLAI